MNIDRFFRAAQWLVDHSTAVVKHVEKQASDHSLLVLDTKPEQRRRKPRFYFDKRWVKKPGFEDVIRKAWDAEYESSQMFQAAVKLRNVG